MSYVVEELKFDHADSQIITNRTNQARAPT